MTKELGVEAVPHASTFVINDEDYTLGNAVRLVLNQDPRVEFCGFSVPHPSDSVLNLRVQTTGEPAKVVLRDALRNLVMIAEHVNTTYQSALNKAKEGRSASAVTKD